MGGAVGNVVTSALAGVLAFSGGPVTIAGFTLTATQIGIITFVGSLAIGFIQQALAPTPPEPDFSPFSSRASRGRTDTFRQPITEWRLVYGEVRTSGPLVYATSTSNDDFLHLVIVLAAHEVEAIDPIFLEDYPIYADQISTDSATEGDVTSGKYAGSVRIKKHLGADSQVADADLVSESSEWTSDHRLRGRAYIYLRLQFDRDLFPGGVPGISAWVKGKQVLDTRGSISQWTPNPALCIRDYLTRAKDQGGGGFDVDEINDDTVDSSANTSEEFVSVTNVALTVDAVDTTNDEVSFDTVALRFQNGDRVQIAGESGDTVPGGLSEDTDYYVIVVKGWQSDDDNPSMQFATSYDNALAGTAITITSVGSGTFTVTKTAEPRYTCNGIIETERTPLDLIDALLTSMAGRAIHSGESWKLLAGAFVSPTLTFDENDLTNNIKIQTKHPRDDRFNRVKGTFVSPVNKGIPTDYEPVTNATFLSEDNNIKLFRELDLPYTSRGPTARRIARIELERHRQQISVNYPTSLTGLQLEAGNTVNIDNSVNGWTGKAFEIVEWSFSVSQTDTEEGDTQVPLIGVDMSLRETASAVYDDEDEDDIDPAPDTTLPNVFNVAAPTGLTLQSGTAQLYVKKDGTVVSRIKVSWTDSTHAFLEQTEIQYKRAADSADLYETIGFVSEDIEQFFIWDVEDGEDYDVRVRAISRLGVRSAYAEVTDHTVIGKTELPSDVASLSAQQNGNVVTFRWTKITDLDRGGYELRFMTAPFTWEDATVITEETKGTLVTNAALPPGVWVVGIKAVDTSGNLSQNAFTANVTVTNENDVVATIADQGPRWPSSVFSGFTKHNVSGKLISNSNTLASAMSDEELWDQMTFDPVVNPTYEGASPIDLGFDADGVRVFGSIDHTLGAGESGTSIVDLQIDYRDDADSYDGYEDWVIGSADFRHLKSRLRADNSSGASRVSQFSTTADVEERTQREEDVAVSIGGTAIVFDGSFHAVPNIQITADGTTALFPIKSAVSKTGFTVQVFDSGGNDVGGTVDWTAVGP